MDSNQNRLKESIVNGDNDAGINAVKECIRENIEPREILAKGILSAIEEVGRLWKVNYFFLPDVIMAAEAFKAAMKELEPSMGSSSYYLGKIVIGTVKGDLHDLGKNIVVAMLKGSVFEVIDLGIDVAVDTFVEKSRDLSPDILGIGAYLGTTIGEIDKIVQTIEEENLRDRLKIIIGGVATSQEYANKVGADLWGKDAMDAVSKIRQVI